jgi:hypothetical protein
MIGPGFPFLDSPRTRMKWLGLYETPLRPLFDTSELIDSPLKAFDVIAHLCGGGMRRIE